MFKGAKVNAMTMMAWREKIAAIQHTWRKEYSPLLISFSVNMVGDIKVNPASAFIFQQGLDAIFKVCDDAPLTIRKQQKFMSKAGTHYIMSIEHIAALELKRLMMQIEIQHPLGRFMDIDVISVNGRPVSRSMLNLEPRQCMVCTNNAKNCARNQTHSVKDIHTVIRKAIFHAR